jgi:hypothetical protein
MTTNEVIGSLENKAFYGSAVSYRKLTAVERIIVVGSEWT